MSDKFSDALAAQLYEISLDSGQDDSLGDVDDFRWFGKFNDYRDNIPPSILEIDGFGFVTAHAYLSQEALDEAWDILEKQYDDWCQANNVSLEQFLGDA